MTTILPLGHFVVTPPASLPAAFFGEDLQEITHGFLADGFAAAARYREELIRQQMLFEDAYRRVEATDATTEQIEATADEVHEYEARALRAGEGGLRRIDLRIRSYRKRGDRNSRSMARLGEEALDICAAWLELYQNLEIRLRKLASDRDTAPPSKTFSDSAEAVRHLRSLATAG